MNYLYSTNGSRQSITDNYGAAECAEGMCMMHQWCPPHYNETYTEHTLEGVLEQNIIVKGRVQNYKGDIKSNSQYFYSFEHL